MTKTQKAIIVDEEVWNKLKSQNMNISQELRDYMQILVERNEKDVEGLSKQLEIIKAKKLRKKLAEMQAELKKTEENIAKIEEKEAENQKKLLENAKKDAEKQEKCLNCGNFILDKYQKFGKGLVCQACFMSADAKSLTKWD